MIAILFDIRRLLQCRVIAEDELSEPKSVKWTQWASYATTLLLVLIVTGTAAYNAREQWWDQYLSFIRR